MSQVDIVGVQHYTAAIGHPNTTDVVGGAFPAMIDGETGQFTSPAAQDAVRGAVAPDIDASLLRTEFVGSRGTLIADWTQAYTGTVSSTDVLPEPGAAGVVAQLPNGLTSVACAANSGAQSSSMKRIGFWAKAERRADGQLSNVFYVDFGADNTFASTAFVAVSVRCDGRWRFYTSQSQAGWGVSGGFVLGTTQFTHVRVRESNSLCNTSVRPALQSGQTIQLGPIYRNPVAKGVAFVRFDDGLVDAFVPRQTLAAPFSGLSGVTLPAGVPLSGVDVAAAFGLPGTMYVLTRHVGDTAAGFLTVEQLRQMQDTHGWLIGFQSHANPLSADNRGLRLLGPDGYNVRPVGTISSVNTGTGVITAASNHQITTTSGAAGNQGYPVELIGSDFPVPTTGAALSAGTVVWLRSVAATTFTMHRTEADSCNNVNALTFSAAGTVANWGYRYRGSSNDSTAIAADFETGRALMQGWGLSGWQHYAPNQGAWDINTETVIQPLFDAGTLLTVNATLANNGTDKFAPRVGSFEPSGVFGFSTNTPQGTAGTNWLNLPVSFDTHAGGSDAETAIRSYVRELAATGAIGSNYHHHFSNQTSLRNFVVYCDELRRLVDQGLLMTGTPAQLAAAWTRIAS